MDIGLFLIYLGAMGAAGATGALFMPGDWYKTLNRPSWTPPDWAFPVVWTVLYLSMAFAAMRVAPLQGSAHAMGFWAIQATLNALWSPVFFGLRRMKAALYVVSALWLAVAATTVGFMALDTVAGMLFIPYLIWVSIAAFLNLTMLRLNPQMA